MNHHAGGGWFVGTKTMKTLQGETCRIKMSKAEQQEVPERRCQKYKRIDF